MLDGVYRIQNGVPGFHSVRTPTDEQLQSLLNQIIKRIMKELRAVLREQRDMLSKLG